MSFENWMLLIIVAQGFAIGYWEFDVWRIHRERFTERKKWREAKQKQAVRKADKSVQIIN